MQPLRLIPADFAARACTLFPEQSGHTLVAAGAMLRGVKTNAVHE